MTITGTSILQRDPGATVVVAPYGPRGPVVSGTSSTEYDIGALGSITFVMNEYGLGFTPGLRLRASALDALGVPVTGQWVEGVATAYSEDLLTINVDLIAGGGTFDSWTIGVTGERGQTGATGATGPTGQVPEAPQNSLKYVRYNASWLSITNDLALKAPLDSPALTGTPTAPTVTPTSDSSTKVATTAFVQSVTVGYQPLDADLTALAAAASTGTTGIYYRKSANTWVPLNMGSGITLDTTSNTLSVTAGGGNVSNSGTPALNDVAQWASSNTIKGVSLATWRTNATFTGTTTMAAATATTPAATDNSTNVATTAYVRSVVRSTYGVRGLAVDSTTGYVVASFYECVLRDAAGVGVVLKNASYTITVAAAIGANGPDATITANGDVSFYAIWGATPGGAGICSNSNPAAGPTLPSGYTHWAYLTTLKRTSGNLASTWTRGNRVTYITQQVIATNVNASSWSGYSSSAFVPLVASNVHLCCSGTAAIQGGAPSGGGLTYFIGAGNGLGLYSVPLDLTFPGMQASCGLNATIPNISQTVWHIYTIGYGGSNFSANGFNITVTGYDVPNGG